MLRNNSRYMSSEGDMSWSFVEVSGPIVGLADGAV